MCVSAETFGSNYMSWSSYSESAFTVFFGSGTEHFLFPEMRFQ